MHPVKSIYRVLRSILLSAVLTVGGLYVLIYTALWIPQVQQQVKAVAVKWLENRIGSRVDVERLSLHPFDEAVLSNVTLYDRKGEKALRVKTLGAGINLWKLLKDGRIEITYAEIIDADISLYQEKEGEALNIQYIIDAFKPEDKTKPPTEFDLAVHNITIRRSALAFEKRWKPRGDKNKFNPDYVHLTDLNADIVLPLLQREHFEIDIRKLAVKESSGLDLKRLVTRVSVTTEAIKVRNLNLVFPHSELTFAPLELEYKGFDDIINSLRNSTHLVALEASPLNLADFKSFVPQFNDFDIPLRLSLDVAASLRSINISTLKVQSNDGTLALDLKGRLDNLADKVNLSVDLSALSLTASSQLIEKVIRSVPTISPQASQLISRLGDINLEATLKGGINNIAFLGKVNSGVGNIDLEATIRKNVDNTLAIAGNLSTQSFSLGRLIDNSRVGVFAAEASADIILKGMDIAGHISANVPFFEFEGKRWTNIAADLAKDSDNISGQFSIDDVDASLSASGNITPAGGDTHCEALLEIDHINFDAFPVGASLKPIDLSGIINLNTSGNSLETLLGSINIENLKVTHSGKGEFHVGDISLISESVADDNRPYAKHVMLDSDFITADVTGNFSYTAPAKIISNLLSSFLPAIAQPIPLTAEEMNSDIEFSLLLKEDNRLPEQFNLPVRMLCDIPVRGHISAVDRIAEMNIDVPYLQQGKDKLLRDIALNFVIDPDNDKCDLRTSVTMPAKKGEVKIGLLANAHDNRLDTDLDWLFLTTPDNRGTISLSSLFSRDEDGKLDFELTINPSRFFINKAVWEIADAGIDFRNGVLDIDNLRVSHGNQFVNIDGKASASADDTLEISLEDIDLSFIFDTLNINYVTFGGRATGLIEGRQLFSKLPLGETVRLHVDSLSYNGAVLGDAELSSKWDHKNMRVSIGADIQEAGQQVAKVDGGVWVTRDSLNFNFDANKVNIKFLKPFMQAFTSDVAGRASGHAHLYGNFSDIDLTGDLFADTIRMKVDYTNCYYAGSDSVHLRPGRIDIPKFRLYDPEGNSANLTGRVNHRYFHDPSFEFNVTDARDLLCYDTNPSLNPDWYGTIYASGSGLISGRPGIVNIDMNMTTAPRSSFTFVLNDAVAAEDYAFLVFTDKKKAAIQTEVVDTVPEIVKRFRKKVNRKEAERPSIFAMNLQATITPDVQMNLIMDPVGGDKIRATGAGAFRIGYNSANDEFNIIGRYELEKGNYNLTLQDIIVKEFIIREGSSISFSGNPFDASLDITAAYRVNTNLSDLDKSFASDRDLNRTSVPVEAVLKVTGEMDHPDIKMDIELPSLTEDVVRKVKSIISTEDMLNTQIVYLLALNRFYTPEYMGGDRSNNELASVASSTISSQLSNMLGQLSEKWSVSPYFRTDKGNFTDTEVDVALSSSLLNDRLIFNGNFGYRDRSTSSTTFIGDFDLEYLLTRNGSLRLKAYNHFNDENYYLRSALTTQGLGVVYKHDFDRWFSFLRPKKKTVPQDTVTQKNKKNVNSKSEKKRGKITF